MSDIAQIGLARDPKHNYFLDGNGPIISVTTVLKIVDKSGPLVGWAKRITAEAAVDHRADLEGWVALGGRDGAVGFLTKAVTHGYAGTLDAIAKIAGETWLIDYKTSKGVYPETALQLAAYGHAEFIGRPGDPTRYAIPPVDQYGVLHLRPEGYELVPMTVDASTFEAFLSAKRLTEWKSGASIGAPVGPALLKFPHGQPKEAVA